MTLDPVLAHILAHAMLVLMGVTFFSIGWYFLKADEKERNRKKAKPRKKISA